MRRAVLLTDSAARDLEEIYDYVARHDAPAQAHRLLDHVERILNSLSESPQRGTFPKELLALGIREYRQVFFKPYSVVYKVLGKNVYVMLIADGRSDMQTLLQRRLLDT